MENFKRDNDIAIEFAATLHRIFLYFSRDSTYFNILAVYILRNDS